MGQMVTETQYGLVEALIAVFVFIANVAAAIIGKLVMSKADKADVKQLREDMQRQMDTKASKEAVDSLNEKVDEIRDDVKYLRRRSEGAS